MEKPWNGQCPRCGNLRAYQGFSAWQCPHPYCDNYTQSQEELVDQEEERMKAAEEAKQKATSRSYVELTDEDLMTHSTVKKDKKSSKKTDKDDDNGNRIDTTPYGTPYDPIGFYSNLGDDDDNEKDDDNDGLAQYNDDIMDLFGYHI